MNLENNLAFAKAQDAADKLKEFRSQFLFPKHNDKEFIYLCGNSLGLQPKAAKSALEGQLDNWANYAVEGWFDGQAPWMYYHKELKKLMAPIVGALPAEVCPMNTLTVNLHLLMVSFYQPTNKRFKILMEGGAFPSDQYAIESQVRFHGFDPNESIIEVFPREGEELLHTDDIIAKIAENADEIALVLFGGINYYTGQWYDMEKITKAGHSIGAIVGWDLAHAAGNVPVRLHDWEVDFACWCSYKYQNSGPGGISGIFVHQKHFDNKNLNRFAGWWGYQENNRFKMEKGFVPEPGADGWQVSCTQVMPMALYHASLQIFEKAGFIDPLRNKSIALTNYLEFIVKQVNVDLGFEQYKIITPSDSINRGAQLSIIAKEKGKRIFDGLVKKHVLGDWREPDVIRLCPIPLYNSFEDIYQTGQILLALSKNILN
ncbi:kynureninase [Pedobacter sp. Leaf176]|uniref:kynureninase n=1 Tax=Pedobacter sp. Leaf176 TaxID=1736286 RepID=UPI0006F4627F|nr:kynureninase [Pedobacter sp. Leaf176]KQR67319.1 kynureninase [Pedobacter sp. Leaf176]